MIAAAALALPVSGQDDLESINRRLAADLVRENDAHGAAIEYRRLSLIADDASARDGYRWLSAYYYLEEENADVAVKVLDGMEQLADETTWKADLLRARAASLNLKRAEELFYLESVAGRGDLDPDAADYASRFESVREFIERLGGGFGLEIGGGTELGVVLVFPVGTRV